jgi:hypothetical protein
VTVRFWAASTGCGARGFCANEVLNEVTVARLASMFSEV